MKRFILLSLVAAVFTACQDGSSPTGTAFETWFGTPSFAILDGSNGGNVDVFFKPPLLVDPTGDANFGDRPPNPDLAPVARICLVVCVVPIDELAMLYRATDGHYAVNWRTRNFPLVSGVEYRIQILLGGVELAYRDVKPRDKAKGFKATCDEKDAVVCEFVNGTTLPIKVRIESFAGCIAANPNFVPATDDCVTASIAPGGSFQAENTVKVTTDINGPPATFNFETCTDLRLRGSGLTDINLGRVDLRTFGDCVEITTLEDVDVVGTATLCDAFTAAAGLTDDQKKRMTVHRFGSTDDEAVALPHGQDIIECDVVVAVAAPAPGGESLALSRLDRLGRFARNTWRAVSDQVRAWIEPAPLFAEMAVVCHRGGCGSKSNFRSSFQAALPAWMDYDGAPADGVFGDREVGTVLTARVKVFDSGEFFPANGPVPAAVNDVRLTVTLTTTAGSSSSEIITGSTGIAEFPFTVALGLNTVTFSGIGVGTEVGAATPVDNVFAADFGDPTTETELEVGTLEFTATGLFGFESAAAPALPSGWTLTGTGGTSGAVTNLGATEGSQFAFINTPGLTTTAHGGTGGSTLESPLFAAQIGDELSIDFNFLTNDGTVAFRDFLFVQLRDASNVVMATIGNANTEEDGDQAIPAIGAPPPPPLTAGVTLSPTTALFGGVATGPVGGVTYGPGKYLTGVFGGSTGYVTSKFTIPATGTYKLFIAVQDVGNRLVSSGAAIDNITLTPAT